MDLFRVWIFRQNGMFQLCGWVALQLFASSACAQSAAEIAFIEQVYVKAGHEQQFEATLKRHWGWHTKQGEKWTYFVWMVDTGKDDGSYRISSFGHTWNEADESNALVAATPGPGEDIGPYEQSSHESYYRYRSDLSIPPPVQKPSDVASVTQVLLKPEAMHDFEVVLRGVKEAAQHTNPQGHFGCWYELVLGGDRPQFLLIEQRPNLTSLQERGELDALMDEAYGLQVSEDALKRLWASMRSIYTETWHYRGDLSRLVNVK